MRSRRHTPLYHFSTYVITLLLVACAGTDIVDDRDTAAIEALQDYEYIYVLGPFDIPDEQDDAGLQDRPRIQLWDRDGKVALKGMAARLYGEAQMEVIAMISSEYETVDADSWQHNYHHVPEMRQGGVVLSDGTIVGWMYRLGGLGYFDFDYDPVVEKVAWFTPKLKTEKQKSPIGRIYRVRSRRL